MIDPRDHEHAERLRKVAADVAANGEVRNDRLSVILQNAAFRIEELSRRVGSGDMSDLECAVWGATYASALADHGPLDDPRLVRQSEEVLARWRANKHEQASRVADAAVALLREGSAKSVKKVK